MTIGKPYYRKKGDRIIIEQKLDGNKTHFIKTLPTAELMLKTFFPEASYFTEEKTIEKEAKSVSEIKASQNNINLI